MVSITYYIYLPLFIDEQDDDDMEVDEMDRFIASEDDQPGYDDEPIRPRVKKIKLADTQNTLDMGISEDAWRDIQDIFGDGTDYDWALELQAESKQESENADRSEKITLDQVYEPSEIKVDFRIYSLIERREC
jgi:transcription elongation factor SPT6